MAKGKKPSAAPKAVASSGSSKGKDNFHAKHPHLFPKDAKDFRVGRDIQPKRDVSRMVKWPRYVRLQRQRAILKKRLKVPPAVHQFTRTLDKNQASSVFRLLAHYRPESRPEKTKRLKEKASKQVKEEKKGADKQLDAATKPLFIKYGLNHITNLVEAKKAKLVVIAHDVDPVELVVWLPALCRKMDVPYCIVKSKARLGQLVHKKTATAIAVTEVKKEDQHKLDQLVAVVRPLYNEDATASKKWGGGVMGVKAQAIVKRREKVAAREATKSLKAQ
jgi:large subunit ribosomal protein L7Ae